MGLFNKIKGIFIEDVPEDEDEDEYEEEKEVKVAKKIESKEDIVPTRRKDTKPLRQEKEDDDDDKRETLNLEIKNDRERFKEKEDEEKIDETKEFDKPPANEFKFPFSDDDFRVEEENKKEEKVEPSTETPVQNVVLYHQTSSITVNDNTKETEYHEVFEQNGQREEHLLYLQYGVF